MPFLTIDGHDSEDFDDAIYVYNQRNKEYLIFICISDVSYYIKTNSYLDKKAYEICNSIYLPQLVFPMFPEFLSNDICSLSPNERKLGILCQIKIKEKGSIIGYEYHKVIIESKMDFNYSEIKHIITETYYKNLAYKNLRKLLKNINDIKNIIKVIRKAGSNINFNSDEIQIHFNKFGSIDNISRKEQFVSHSIIEEFMILANLLVSKFLEKKNFLFIKRRHDPPYKKKSVVFNKIMCLSNDIFRIKIFRYWSLRFYLKLASHAKKTLSFFILQKVILKMLEKASYDTLKNGHFGLNLQLYTHFTSPIRRYSDLIIHRIIKCFLENLKNNYNVILLSQLSRRFSLYEIKTSRIHKKIKFFIVGKYLLKNLNKVHEAVIIDIKKFGVIIKIKNLEIYGLINNIYKKYFTEKNIFCKLRKKKIIRVKVLYINEVKEIINFFIVKNKSLKMKSEK